MPFYEYLQNTYTKLGGKGILSNIIGAPWKEGIDSYISTAWKQHIDFNTTLDFYLWNTGLET